MLLFPTLTGFPTDGFRIHRVPRRRDIRKSLQPMSQIDQMAMLKCNTQFWPSQPPLKNCADYRTLVLHFKAEAEGSLIDKPVPQDAYYGIPDATATRQWFIEFREIQLPHPISRSAPVSEFCQTRSNET